MTSYFCRRRSLSSNILNVTVQQNIRSKGIINYRLPRARRVVESAFGICASKWRILDKVVETKIDTGLEIVKCIYLLQNIRLWGLSAFPIISALLRIAAAHKSDHEGSSGQRSLVAATRQFSRYTLQRRTAPFIYMCLSTARRTQPHPGLSECLIAFSSVSLSVGKRLIYYPHGIQRRQLVISLCCWWRVLQLRNTPFFKPICSVISGVPFVFSG
jgi:hypothetical protein